MKRVSEKQPRGTGGVLSIRDKQSSGREASAAALVAAHVTK